MEHGDQSEKKPTLVGHHNEATQAGCTSQEAALYSLYFGDSMSMLDLSGPHLTIAEVAGHLVSAGQKIENARNKSSLEES